MLHTYCVGNLWMRSIGESCFVQISNKSDSVPSPITKLIRTEAVAGLEMEEKDQVAKKVKP